jgi:hypothetical protein
MQADLASTVSRQSAFRSRVVLVLAAMALAFLLGATAGYVARSLTAVSAAHAPAVTQVPLSTDPAWGYSVRRHGTQSVEGSSLENVREPGAGRGGPQLVV